MNKNAWNFFNFHPHVQGLKEKKDSTSDMSRLELSCRWISYYNEVKVIKDGISEEA